MSEEMNDHHKQTAEKIFKEMSEYSKKKKIWYKAFEILQEILLLIDDTKSAKEKEIYKFQLILNYLNHTDNESKIRFILSQFNLMNDYQKFVEEKLLTTLRSKIEIRNQKDKQHKEQKFR